MGLEEFSTDGNTSSTSSTSNRSKSNSASTNCTDNTPSEMKQMFLDHPDVNPRSIKYQVKSYGCKWVYQFSTRRTDKGELVMYASPFEKDQTHKTVMVFTTIASVTDEEYSDDLDSIWVTCWNLKKNEPIGDGIHIESEDNWRDKLNNAVIKEIKKRKDIVKTP